MSRSSKDDGVISSLSIMEQKHPELQLSLGLMGPLFLAVETILRSGRVHRSGHMTLESNSTCYSSATNLESHGGPSRQLVIHFSRGGLFF